MGYLFIIIVILVAFSWFTSTSNRLRRHKIVIKESKRNVDIALAKRYDTISQMLKVAKSFAKHETDTLTETIKLRQEGGITAANMTMKSQNDAIKGIYALAEAYPDLKSSAEFVNLQDELADENEKLATAQRIVNSTTSLYNHELVTFPTSIIASINNMKEIDFLTEEDLERKKSIDQFDYDI